MIFFGEEFISAVGSSIIFKYFLGQKNDYRTKISIYRYRSTNKFTKKKLDRSIQILQNDLYDFSFSFFFLFKFTRIIYMINFFNLTVNFIKFVLVEELLSIVILL
jgi:hypothetical protein